MANSVQVNTSIHVPDTKDFLIPYLTNPAQTQRGNLWQFF